MALREADGRYQHQIPRGLQEFFQEFESPGRGSFLAGWVRNSASAPAALRGALQLLSYVAISGVALGGGDVKPARCQGETIAWIVKALRYPAIVHPGIAAGNGR